MLGNPQQFIINAIYLVPAILVGIVWHEFAHAGVAVSRGDQTPRTDGRLSLNPSSHLDPLGTLAAFFIHFGWGKPMRLNPYRMRGPWDPVLVWIAGPLASLAAAVALSIPLKLLLSGNLLSIDSPPFQIILVAFYFNVLLGIVNILPIPSLDGYNAIATLFRRRYSKFFYRVDANRQVVLLIAVIVLFILPGVLDLFYDPVSRLLLGDVLRPTGF